MKTERRDTRENERGYSEQRTKKGKTKKRSANFI
jgi:hypothetical protein